MIKLPERIIWFSLIFLLALLVAGWSLVFSSPQTRLSDILTREEAAWLQQHSRLRLAPDPHFPPIEYFDEKGRYQGVVSDYYHAIEEVLGIHFEVVQASTWDEVLQMAQRRDIDIVGAAQQTPEREAYLQFSQSIIDIPNVIVVTDKSSGEVGFAGLAGRRLAVTRGNALHEFVRTNFPQVVLVPVDNDLAGLQEVAFDRVDATVINLATATWLIREHGLTHLRVAGDSGRANALHIATRSDWPALNSILSKALASLPETTRADIQQQWIRLDDMPLTHHVLLMLVSGLTFITLLIGGILWVNRSLRSQVNVRTAALNQELLERKLAEERIHFLAYHDALTHLPNRVFMQERFDVVVRITEPADKAAALLFLDLDNFKTINDSLGHAAGDVLLKEVATRLLGCMRPSDTLCRQGGDEFLLLLTPLGDVDELTPMLQALMQALAPPLWIEDHEFVITASIGVAVFPRDGRDFVTLSKKADMALYRAKDAGRNTYYFFDESMNFEAQAHLATRNGLRRALEQQEFVLHYQPQIDLVTGKVSGVEALIRWQPFGQELLPPSRFITIAEESRLIVPIGQWVLQEACRQASLWQQAGMSSLVVAVNLSAVQFYNVDLVGQVTRALTEHDLPPECLELELTESILLHQLDSVMDTLVRLKKLGVKLSIDDFGTGYSSLSYLKRFDIDKLKIDRSFVRDINHDADDSAIVRAIIQMGHGLNLRIIAEGVEDITALEQLRRLGCDEAQGYYYARPMPADVLMEFLREHVPVGKTPDESLLYRM